MSRFLLACDGAFGRATAVLEVVVRAEPLQGVRAEYFTVDPEVPLCEAEPEGTLVVSTVEPAIDRPYQNA